MTVEYSDGTGWVDRPDATAPALEGDVACDVAVVGGGLAGMAAALRLAERGADVVLLANTLAADPDLLSTLLRRRLPDLLRSADAAVHFAEALLARLSIECDCERTGIVARQCRPGSSGVPGAWRRCSAPVGTRSSWKLANLACRMRSSGASGSGSAVS